MNHLKRLALAVLLSLPFSSQAEESAEQESVQWLDWPVTAHPFSSVDSGALVPPAETRFQIEAHRDVQIGLRSDGTVVWRFVEEVNKSGEEAEESVE